MELLIPHQLPGQNKDAAWGGELEVMGGHRLGSWRVTAQATGVFLSQVQAESRREILSLLVGFVSAEPRGQLPELVA